MGPAGGAVDDKGQVSSLLLCAVMVSILHAPLCCPILTLYLTFHHLSKGLQSATGLAMLAAGAHLVCVMVCVLVCSGGESGVLQEA